MSTALNDQHGAQRALRTVLGRFATGVTVMTAVHGGARAGITVNSFTPLSLEPPLVMWCLRRASTSRPVFASASHFAVHVLAADQRDLAVRFAGPGDRFAGVTARTGPHGVPLLDGAVATLLCRRGRLVPAGDHLVLVGTVVTHSGRPGPALIFHDGDYLTSSPTDTPAQHRAGLSSAG